MEHIEVHLDDYLISTDKYKLDVIAIHDFLANHAGWCNNIPYRND